MNNKLWIMLEGRPSILLGITTQKLWCLASKVIGKVTVEFNPFDYLLLKYDG